MYLYLDARLPLSGYEIVLILHSPSKHHRNMRGEKNGSLYH